MHYQVVIKPTIIGYRNTILGARTIQIAFLSVPADLLLALNTVLVMKNARMDAHATIIIPIIAMILVSQITMTWITTSVAVPMTSVQ